MTNPGAVDRRVALRGLAALGILVVVLSALTASATGGVPTVINGRTTTGASITLVRDAQFSDAAWAVLPQGIAPDQSSLPAGIQRVAWTSSSSIRPRWTATGVMFEDTSASQTPAAPAANSGSPSAAAAFAFGCNANVFTLTRPSTNVIRGTAQYSQCFNLILTDSYISLRVGGLLAGSHANYHSGNGNWTADATAGCQSSAFVYPWTESVITHFLATNGATADWGYVSPPVNFRCV